MNTQARSRHFRRIALGLASTLVGVLALGASASFADEKLPAGGDLLDRHLEATGGKEARLAIKTRKMTGTLAVDLGGHKFEAKIERQVRAPGSGHLVIQGDQIFQVRANNEQHAWEWSASRLHGEDGGSGEGSTRHLDGAARARAIEESQLHGDLDWRSRYTKAKTIGLADVEGRPAYEVQLTTNSGEQQSRFYDQENGRLVKSVREIEMPQIGKVDTEIFSEDYREFDGVWLATRIRQVLRADSFGSGTQIWTYDSVEHNVSIPSSLFQVPEDAE